MKILQKLIEKIKNLFNKKEEILMIDEPKVELNEKRERFKNSLKNYVEEIKQKRKEVETLVCYGDGLGIKKSLKY